MTEFDPASNTTIELRQAEAEMEAVYQSILQRHTRGRDANHLLTLNLRKAQRAWLMFRDAHLAAIYSEKVHVGAVANSVRALICAEMTRTRTAQLREWWE